MTDTGLSNVTVGARVRLQDDRTGTVGFIGPVHFRPNVVAGVDLDPEYEGTGDGSVRGWQYFDATPGQAVFVTKAELILIDSEGNTLDWSMDGDVELDDLTELDDEGDPMPMTEEIEDETEPDSEDDKYDRWARGQTAALQNEAFDYKGDPEDTKVEVNYALYKLPYEQIKKAKKNIYREAIYAALPEDLQEKLSSRDLDLTFEDLGEYTELKCIYDRFDNPADADDLRWTQLDPIHVRKFKEELQEDTATNLIDPKYSYLVRRGGDGCCKWVKPCLACICCWLLLLTLLLALMFMRLAAMQDDVDDLKNNGLGVSGNFTISCDGFDICEQIAANADAVSDMQDQVAQNREDIDNLMNGGLSGPGVKETEIIREPIDNTGGAIARCPTDDYEIISCWVYLPNNWNSFIRYTDPDPTDYPDCSCYCEHTNDANGCVKTGAECRAQCVLFG